MNGKLSFVPTPSGGLRPDGDIAGASLRALRQCKADLTRWLVAAGEKTAAGPLSDSDRANLTAARTYMGQVATALADREAANEAERELARNGGRLDADGLASEQARRAAALPANRSMGVHQDLSQARPATDRTYAGLFGPSARSFDGWDTGTRAAATEFCRCVALGLNDSRLLAAAMSGSEGGGYAIPPGVFGGWLDTALESEIVRPRAQNWPILQGRERTIPAWDLTDRSNGLAGFAISWQGENPASDATPQVGTVRQVKLMARRGSIFAATSNELLEDGLDFDAQLEQIMSKALSYGLDESFLFGSGSNEPLGVFNSAVLLTVSRSTSNLILYDDLVSMFSRMNPASIPNSIWVAHSSTIPQLATLSVPVGTGGSHVPVMTESNGEFRILTRPVVFTEKAKPLGQLGDIALCDFSRYAIGLRRDATLEKSIHVGFLKNQQYFRLQIRIDGMPVDRAPTQPPNSAPTQSPFVALAA